MNIPRNRDGGDLAVWEQGVWKCEARIPLWFLWLNWNFQNVLSGDSNKSEVWDKTVGHGNGCFWVPMQRSEQIIITFKVIFKDGNGALFCFLHFEFEITVDFYILFFVQYTQYLLNNLCPYLKWLLYSKIHLTVLLI